MCIVAEGDGSPRFCDVGGTPQIIRESMFRALEAAGLTFKQSNIHFGPKEVYYLDLPLSCRRYQYR